MVDQKKKYLDPEIVARIGNLSVAARTVVEGFISGLHQSQFKGFSVEFAQHREYSPGDEVKHIDWKVFGRSDKYVVRQYEEETNMRCFLMMDTSRSMQYKYIGQMDKITYACYLAASLAYLMLRQQDSVGLVTFDSAVNTIVPPRSHQGHLNNIIDVLDHIVVHETVSISSALSDVGKRLRKRHLLIVLSDLLGDPEELLKAIRYFQFRKHEVMVFQILDTAERTLPFEGSILFQGLEDREEVLTEPRLIRKQYTTLMNQSLDTYYWGFKQTGIDYQLVETSQPFERALMQFLTKRMSR